MIHWHIGYYENGCDFEAVGYPNRDGTWNIYFEDYTEEEGLHVYNDKGDRVVVGKFLFKVVSREEAEEKFHKWIENELIPRRGL